MKTGISPLMYFFVLELKMEIVIAQWSEPGGNSDDEKTQVSTKLQGSTTQTVTHR